jgi:hypothetical protein
MGSTRASGAAQKREADSEQLAMSLHVRLFTNFWTHRKTMRLRAIIGDAALWVPPRIWCYAAEHQPDGDFSDYLPGEVALLIGYSGDAQALLEALQQSAFMDGMKLHGWKEHNEYHAVYSKRASKAARARWDKKGTEKRGEEASIAPSMLQASPLSHIPTLEEWIAYLVKYLIPREFCEEKYNYFDRSNWDGIKNWQAAAKQVNGWWLQAKPTWKRNGSNGTDQLKGIKEV